MKVFIGTSGWQYWHWKGIFYPENIKSDEMLKFYAENFNTVEINTTFYHFQKTKTFLKWKDIVRNKNFIFSLKLHRLFTHFRRLKLKKDDLKILKGTVNSFKELKENLGPIIIQLPPSLKADLKTLQKFLDILKKFNLKFALEFRNKSWLKPSVYRILKKYKVSFVISDSPRWPTEIIKTSSFVYVRFHGKPKIFASLYKDNELEEWSKNLKKLKPKELYIYFNNDFSGYAVQNALYMKKLLKS